MENSHKLSTTNGPHRVTDRIAPTRRETLDPEFALTPSNNNSTVVSPIALLVELNVNLQSWQSSSPHPNDTLESSVDPPNNR